MIQQTMTVTCDKCGKEITGAKYYTVDIQDHAIRRGDLTLDYLADSITPAILVMPGPERHYCRECISEINNFIFSKKEE